MEGDATRGCDGDEARGTRRERNYFYGIIVIFVFEYLTNIHSSLSTYRNSI